MYFEVTQWGMMLVCQIPSNAALLILSATFLEINVKFLEKNHWHKAFRRLCDGK
jgi:hypothetical protein